MFRVVFDGKRTQPQWFLNEKSCSKKTYEERMVFRAFWIQSDHLRVISGDPSERRNFLDDMLTVASPGYEKILQNYRRALTSRNKTISLILEKQADKKDLATWNILLAEYGVKIITERRKFFSWLQGQSFKHLSLPGEVRVILAERHPLETLHQDSFLTLLSEYQERDLIVGRTTVGPHLDEIDFSVNIENTWKPTKYILSRGENKILLLAFIRLL